MTTKEYWITAYDPNNQSKEEAFKIAVQEEMVWNLIEEDKEYFTLYAKEENKPWILELIEHLAIGCTSRLSVPFIIEYCRGSILKL